MAANKQSILWAAFTCADYRYCCPAAAARRTAPPTLPTCNRRLFKLHSFGLATNSPSLPLLLHPSTAVADAVAPAPAVSCGNSPNVLRKCSDRHIHACVSSSVVPGGRRSLMWQDVLSGSGRSCNSKGRIVWKSTEPSPIGLPQMVARLLAFGYSLTSCARDKLCCIGIDNSNGNFR